MDELNNQLSQLHLMNTRDLSPKSKSLPVKKVGPAVPPKPNKKLQLVQATATRNDYSNMKMTLDNPAILEQKLEALEHHKKVLENQQKRRLQNTSGTISSTGNTATMTATTKTDGLMGKVAISNATNSNSKIYENQSLLYENLKNGSAGGKMATATVAAGVVLGAVDDGGRSSDNSGSGTAIYSNLQQLKGENGAGFGSDLIYSNIVHSGGSGSGGGSGSVNGGTSGIRNGKDELGHFYGSASTGICYPHVTGSGGGTSGGEIVDVLPPPPPLEIPPPLNIVDTDYNNYTSEDDLPPPPSPVSSSYSELRRATDNSYSSGMPSYGTTTHHNHHHHHPQATQQLSQQTSQQSSEQALQQQQQQQQQQHQQQAAHKQQQSGHYQQLNMIVGLGGATATSTGMIANTVRNPIGIPNVQSAGFDNQLNEHNAQQAYSNSYQPSDYRTYVPSSQSFNSDYYSFGSSSQTSSTYESIYEPINPRPPSQMSSRSNYSLYTPYISGPQTHKLPCQKEAEVDALTDLLVRSMDNNQDMDSYGICVQCGERVVGENSGCTAMEQIYHIACFTCCQCQINLQGKPFYALDGKPCCEEDYLNTLEKCSVCMKPILERILRATGKPYHPGCFCCVVCGKSLDGVPFTVDATNQNHCIEDFHRKFAPRCCVCRQPIMPEPGKEETVRVVALDRSFHVSCYKCEDCGLLLSSEAEGRGCFPLDDHILCKSCNAKRVQALTSHMTTEL